MTMLSSMPNIALTTIVRASPQQVSCNVADEAVLLSMRDGEYYGLNEVAACIWRHVQEARTVLEIRDALLSEYDAIGATECEAALFDFLSEMISLQLVDVV
ncbi:MAG TPA: PqqD family protein [Gemmatimonadaceae bacterium]|nr:PqqD family protein [Gemmatimonadaceae bacterium]